MKPILENHKLLIERLERKGIDYKTDRWEEGCNHHPSAEKFASDLEAIDWIYNDDYFHWKFGGDGDNGEILLYALDILFELYDKEKQ